MPFTFVVPTERKPPVGRRRARAYEELATNELPGGFWASPAVSGKALYLRTKTHLVRVEE